MRRSPRDSFSGRLTCAVLTGEMAGRNLGEGEPEEFEEEALDTFGITINRAAEKRKKYMKRWDDLKEIVPKTWIAFEEYYKD